MSRGIIVWGVHVQGDNCLGGRCPRDNCLGGTFPRDTCLGGTYPRDNCLRGTCPGDNCLGGTIMLSLWDALGRKYYRMRNVGKCTH